MLPPMIPEFQHGVTNYIYLLPSISISRLASGFVGMFSVKVLVSLPSSPHTASQPCCGQRQHSGHSGVSPGSAARVGRGRRMCIRRMLAWSPVLSRS